jgi:hypothetical protein
VTDWREGSLDMVEHFRGVAFRRKAYSAYRPGWDHDHCALCGVKFMERSAGVPDTHHEGYATTENWIRGADYDWFCIDCFEFCRGRLGLVDVAERAIKE